MNINVFDEQRIFTQENDIVCYSTKIYTRSAARNETQLRNSKADILRWWFLLNNPNAYMEHSNLLLQRTNVHKNTRSVTQI